MADLSHRLPDTANEGWDLRYARMIPGTPGPPPVAAPNISPRHKHDDKARASHESAAAAPSRQAHNQACLYQLATLDLVVLLAACLPPSIILPAWSLPLLSVPVYAVLLILFAFSEGLYNGVGQPPAKEFPILARSALFAMALVLAAAWKSMEPLAALTVFATSLIGLVLLRQIRGRWWNEHFRSSAPRNVLMIGAGPTARTIARALRDDPFHASTVVGFLDDHLPLTPEVLGRLADLDWLARSQFIDEVILVVPNEPTMVRAAAAVALRNHLDIRAVPDLPAGFWPEAGVERIGGVPMIVLHRESMPRALLLKRALDVVGALVGLTVLAPIMGLLALWIRLDSPGPVFYAAQRTGAKGRPFRCYKFRSMISGAEQLKQALSGRNEREGPIFKLADDPRITRFGRFLRRYSLDELPQLWNVLLGNMSLVGPRPHPVEEVDHYQLPHYRRLDMKPGITGLWQITARNSPSFDLNMHLDLTYIENWTLVLDLRILMSTFRVLFSPEGA